MIIHSLASLSRFYENYMKKILRTFAAAGIFSALALVSCKKDEAIYYGNVTMGNIDGETIISDQGNIFDIAESGVTVNLASFEYGRVMLSCDVLKKTQDQRYDIRLTGIASVLTKDAVKASTITDPESELAVENAINIREMWYSGGYLNMLIEFAQKQGSKTKHFINLIHDDVTAASEDQKGKYTFTLRHNAYGEVPVQNETYVSSMGYVSFPIANLIEGDEADITIKWKSHKYENGAYDLYETQDASEDCKWKRSGFEQNTTKKSVETGTSFCAR